MTGLEPLAAEIARSLVVNLGKTAGQRAGKRILTAAFGTELEREVADSLNTAMPGAVESTLRMSGNVAASRSEVEAITGLVAEALTTGLGVGPALLSLDRDALTDDSIRAEWTGLVNARLVTLKVDASSPWSELHKLDLVVLSSELVSGLVAQLRSRSASGSLLGLGLHLESAHVERALRTVGETIQHRLDTLDVSIPERVAQRRRDEETARLQRTFEKYLKAVSGPESKVKFEIEQIDQTSDLSSLFIDVPIGRRRTDREWEANLSPSLGPDQSGADRRTGRGKTLQFEPIGFGAAEFLLRIGGDIRRIPWLATSLEAASADQPARPSRILLRGAPGAGKSTVTQFVCQIHRAKLLGTGSGLSAVPAQWEPDQVRWPLRIDIKPLSIWLSGKDPYSPSPHSALPFDAPRSVEDFLAFHVQRMTRGLTFSVDDLYDFLAGKHLLLVFDGLDEISESAVSEEVLEHMLTTAGSFAHQCASLQLVVTSRPVSPARAPIFTTQGFMDFELLALPPEVAMDYATGWVRAKDLNEIDSMQVLDTLSASLQHDHVKELARNCMQLAILLAVITANRSALPNGRTPLYSEYVRVFFKREAVKNQLVADHPLIIEAIHHRAAWTLQSEGERGDVTGVSREWLIEQARDLLLEEGKRPELAGDIITAAERNYLLVTRTESRAFDFEVDPLREYFCGCHIYETASSRVGAGVSSRFDAMIKNPHWFEVTRFFAGMAKNPELAEFAYDIRDLLDDEKYAGLGHPRVLGFTLLGDRVFRNSTMIEDITGALLDDQGIRLGLTHSASRRGMPLSLAPASWRVMLDLAKERLTKHPDWDFVRYVGEAMRWGIDALGDDAAQSLLGWFQAHLRSSGANDRDFRYWLDAADAAEALRPIGSDDAGWLLTQTNDRMDPASSLLFGEVYGPLTESAPRVELAIAAILEGRVFRRGSTHPLGQLADVMTSLWYGTPSWEWDPIAPVQDEDSTVDTPPNNEVERLLNSCSDFVERVHSLRDWIGSAQPWHQMVEDGRARFGEHRMFTTFACIAATLPGLDVSGRGNDLFDTGEAICARTANGWVRRDDVEWWDRQLKAARDHSQIELVLLAILSLATGRVIATLADEIETTRQRVPERWRGAILRLIDNVHCRSTADDQLDQLPDRPTPWLSTALAIRATPEQRSHLHRIACVGHAHDDLRVLELCLSECASVVDDATGDEAWLDVLDVARRLHTKGVVRLESLWPPGRLRSLAAQLPQSLARRILTDCADYPFEFVEEADRISQQDVQNRIEPLSATAKRDGWFEDKWTPWDRKATGASS